MDAMEDGSCGACEGRAPAGIPQEEILRGADLWSGRLEDTKFLLALFLSICLSRCLYRSLSPSLFVCLCLPICLSLFLSLPLYLYLSFLPKSVSLELGEARGWAHSALALSATGLGGASLPVPGRAPHRFCASLPLSPLRSSPSVPFHFPLIWAGKDPQIREEVDSSYGRAQAGKSVRPGGQIPTEGDAGNPFNRPL